MDGLIVASGLIDCHSHSDLDLLADPMATAKVAQGVTTEMVANCGFGPFPVRSEEAERQISAMLPPEGMVHVICNGLPDGARTERRPGVFLRPAR